MRKVVRRLHVDLSTNMRLFVSVPELTVFRAVEFDGSDLFVIAEVPGEEHTVFTVDVFFQVSGPGDPVPSEDDGWVFLGCADHAGCSHLVYYQR